MKLPKFLQRKASKSVSEIASSEFGRDCHVRIDNVELGVKDKKVYFRANLEGEMDVRDLIAVLKMSMADEL